MHARGFTLVELIMVMILAGILAVAAIPRFFDKSTFEAKGFYDETFAILRYAQKAAIAKRRTVCVVFTSTTVTLTIASAAASTVCDKNVISPTGASPYVVTAKSSISFATVPTGFQFTSLGQASVGQTITVTGASGSIVIEQETGYVHS